MDNTGQCCPSKKEGNQSEEPYILLTLSSDEKKIADLKEDIKRLSEELTRKASLLWASLMDVASGQSKQISSLHAVL